MSGECFGKDVKEDDIHFIEENCSPTEKNRKWLSSQDRDISELKLLDIKPAVNTNKCRSLLRQNSGAISTDSSGAAVVTINNILSGITNSINRLSELHGCIDIDKRDGKLAKNILQDNDDNDNTMSEEMLLNKKRDKKRYKRRSSACYKSSSSLLDTRIKAKAKNVKKEDTKRASNTSIKKHKIKRLQLVSKSSDLRGKPKTPPKLPTTTNNLVELYHNIAAKSSESDENINANCNKKCNGTKVCPSKKFESSFMTNTSSGNERKSEVRCPPKKTDNQVMRPLAPIQEQHFDLYEGTTFGTDISVFHHNYETPTISSKMKQVTRTFFNNFAEKSIPFCVATSTSPSHNIGINIQQVMNIIKNKQSIKGISPTLAHNIGIAAEKLNHESLSALVSSFGLKFDYSSNVRCPMVKGTVNYQQLQELAKDVIEEVEEKEDKTELESPNKPLPSVWTLDPNKLSNCTCVPRQGIGFQQILNRYQHITNYQTPNSEYSQSVMKKSKQRYKHVKSVYAQYNDQLKGRRDSVDEQSNNKSAGEGSTYLKGKEKVLKGVLLNLHNEFQQLSDRYDELSKSMNAGGDGEINASDVKEIEQLEKKLNSKEEEIEMVMSLYGEVMELKQQVKMLREKNIIGTGLIEHDKHDDSISQSYQQIRKRSQGPEIAHISKYLRQFKNHSRC